MLGFLRDWWKKQDRIVYIRIRNNKITVYHYPQGVEYEDDAILAVRHSGSKKSVISAVGKAVFSLKENEKSVVYEPFNPFTYEDPENFTLAEKLIRALLTSAPEFRHTLVSPRVIIHPDKTYISDMEEQAYRELALSAGAREAVVYVGDRLSENEIENIMNTKSKKAGTASP